MSHPVNDEILERLYEEEVQESLEKLEKLGFKDIKESNLDQDSIKKTVISNENGKYGI